MSTSKRIREFVPNSGKVKNAHLQEVDFIKDKLGNGREIYGRCGEF